MRILDSVANRVSSERARSPVFWMMWGANDPRVKRAKAEQIVEAMRNRDLPVEYLLFEDEGHGFARPENREAAFLAPERYLAKVPGR